MDKEGAAPDEILSRGRHSLNASVRERLMIENHKLIEGEAVEVQMIYARSRAGTTRW
jgi:hypothetical protein